MIELDTIYFGDCLIGMSNILDKSINMICCDLPFGTTQNKWDTIISFTKLWVQYKRIIKNNGAIVLFCQQPFTSKLICSNLKMYRYNWIWEKSHTTGFLNAKKMPMKKTEDIAVFYKKLPIYNPQLILKDPKNIRTKNIRTKKGGTKQHTNYGKFKTGNFRDIPNNMTYPNNILKFNSAQNYLHPTEKPEPLISYLIKTYTNENDIILDNCIGSGTTAISCKMLNRHYIGYENNKKNYNIAIDRCNKFDSELRLPNV